MQREWTAPQFQIEVDGRSTPAWAGDTVAAVLLRAGVSTFRHTQTLQPRGIFCGMGTCFDCLVTVDDLPDQRACITLARPGMQIRTYKAPVP